MPTFGYQARTAAGVQDSGTLRSATLATALRDLNARNLTVLVIEPKKPWWELTESRARIKPASLGRITRMMAILMEAGFPLPEAVERTRNASGNRTDKKILAEVSSDLAVGLSLSAAMAKHPRSFPRYYRSLLAAGEQSGDLTPILKQLAGYVERDREAARKMRQGLMYPTLVLVTALAVSALLLGVGLPALNRYTAELGGETPTTTLWLKKIQTFMDTWGTTILLVFLLLVLVYLVVARTPRGKLARDRTLLRIPVIGPILRLALTERYARVLGSQLGAGVPMPEAMRIATDSVGNHFMTGRLEGAESSVLAGDQLSAALATADVFPPTAVELVRIGEESAVLDKSLDDVARFSTLELDSKLKTLITYLEPAALVLTAVVVGLVAIALIEGLYGSLDSLRPGGGSR